VDEERGVVELELSDDVLLDGGRGGGGEGDDGRGAQCGQVVAEGAVVGAEVMAPGADAVGFVDGDEGGLAAGEHLGKAGDAEAFGGDEEELEGAVEIVAAGLAGVVAGEAGVDAADAQAVGGELGGLIVHEGDEGGDDERSAGFARKLAGDGGELVAEALAGAGGHDEENVAAVGGGAADGFLVGAEGGETEGALEQGGEVGHCSGGSRLVSHGWCSLAGVKGKDKRG
jgi:hypothetical protein